MFFTGRRCVEIEPPSDFCKACTSRSKGGTLEGSSSSSLKFVDASSTYATMNLFRVATRAPLGRFFILGLRRHTESTAAFMALGNPKSIESKKRRYVTSQIP
jgi:hypothetical protein